MKKIKRFFFFFYSLVIEANDLAAADKNGWILQLFENNYTS